MESQSEVWVLSSLVFRLRESPWWKVWDRASWEFRPNAKAWLISMSVQFNLVLVVVEPEGVPPGGEDYFFDTRRYVWFPRARAEFRGTVVAIDFCGPEPLMGISQVDLAQEVQTHRRGGDRWT